MVRISELQGARNVDVKQLKSPPMFENIKAENLRKCKLIKI